MMESVHIVWMVVIATYAIKHFLADFVLQNEYMLGKFKPYPHCILPLIAHCSVHTLFSAIILLSTGISLFEPDMLHMFLIVLLYEFTSHFVVDIIKAQWVTISKVTSKDHSFWVAVGLDQLAHLLSSLPILSLLVYLILL